MANVLVSFYAPPLERESILFSFYEGFIGRLRAQGNNVLVHNTAYMYYWGYEDKFNRQHVEESITNFNPDLVLAFNNQRYKGIDSLVDCPIVIWNSDFVELFPEVDELRRNASRYHFFSFLENGVKDYTDNGIPKDRISIVRMATAYHAEKSSQDKDISFIATKFHSSSLINKLLEDPVDNVKINALLRKFWSNPIYDKDDFFKAHAASDIGDKLSLRDFWQFAHIREITLMALLEFDLHLYGHHWELYAPAFFPMYAAYRHKEVFSLRHNQDIYNTSRICLNVNHPQAGNTGFSFRMLDIMATNGCLVSNHSKGIEDYTKGFVDIPMFKTPWESREVCREILKNDRLRNDIVAASQNCINATSRWEHRFKDIEGILAVKLLNEGAEPGRLEFVNIADDLARREAERLALEQPMRLLAEKKALRKLKIKMAIDSVINTPLRKIGLELKIKKGDCLKTGN